MCCKQGRAGGVQAAVSCTVGTGLLLQGGDEAPGNLSPAFRVQASYIPVTNVYVEAGHYPYHLPSAGLGSPRKAD